MPSHVCVITAVHQPFDGRIFHRQCRTLAAAGYQVTLVAPAEFDTLERDGVRFLGLPRPRSRWHRPAIWWRLFATVRRIRPAVVHFHDPELLLLVPLLKSFVHPRPVLIYDAHEYFADAVRGKYWIPRPFRPAIAALAAALEKWMVHAVDGIVTAVPGQVPLFEGAGKPVAVVRNLPFTALFDGAEPRSEMQAPGLRLLYIGLILPKRGIDVLLDAMRILRDRSVGDVYLFLVGPTTSAEYIQHIRASLAKDQLTERVKLLGFVEHDQLKHYLTSAHAGLAPGLVTRQYQNPGLTTKIFEYLLAGLPVLSADYPHRRAVIDEANCGLAVPPEDAEAHADAILWLRDHPDEARTMGERGRAMVLDHYTWESEQSRLLDFYTSLLGTADGRDRETVQYPQLP
jgi:glycosyltransferase involved in cell wall biosynthesis